MLPSSDNSRVLQSAYLKLDQALRDLEARAEAILHRGSASVAGAQSQPGGNTAAEPLLKQPAAPIVHQEPLYRGPSHPAEATPNHWELKTEQSLDQLVPSSELIPVVERSSTLPQLSEGAQTGEVLHQRPKPEVSSSVSENNFVSLDSSRARDSHPAVGDSRQPESSHKDIELKQSSMKRLWGRVRDWVFRK